MPVDSGGKELEVGDIVSYYSNDVLFISYYIGEMNYSQGEAILLADEKSIGMPINSNYCTYVMRKGALSVNHLRERHMNQFPLSLKGENGDILGIQQNDENTSPQSEG